MTEQFPLGKLRADDEGMLKIQIASLPDAVLVRFEKVIGWVGLDQELAIQIVASLRAAAAEVFLTEPSGMSHPVAISKEKGRIILTFPKPTDFLGLSKVAALALADSIQELIGGL